MTLRLGHLAALAGGVTGSVVSLGVLTNPTAPPLHISLPDLFPFARMSLTVDGLSAFFLLVVSLVGVAAALYGPAYLGAHHGTAATPSARSMVVKTVALNAFIAFMALLCCAGDALSFLLFWEGMTVASYALIVAEAGSLGNARAALIYLVMAHAATALLMVVFLVLVERGQGFDFEALRRGAADLPEGARTALLLAALLGFSVKAGVVPLHVWLPHAHPAAPSHVSALMSGVMLKVAIYGMLRFAFDLVAPTSGPLPSSWGWTTLAFGTLSGVVGVLYALQQHDIKRLLAFHSVENVGIILMGVGLAMLLKGRGGAADGLATLALVAALLHTINHAAFKGLLFLGAGAVLAKTGHRNMEELGGLARRMPWTAWLFLLGAVAISALPPLNGFVSEWMTLQALVLGGAVLHGPSGVMLVFAAAMLALTGGLAAACFVKAFGVTFLGRPRSAEAEHATEAPASMIAGMVVLAVVCLALGVLPGYAIVLLDGPTTQLLGGPAASAVVTAQGPLVLSVTGVPADVSATAISATAVAILLASLTLVVWALRRRARGRRRFAPTWTCGNEPLSRFDYTATAFAKPLRVVFATLYRPTRHIERELGPSPYAVTSIHYSEEVADLAETQIYDRMSRVIGRLSLAIRARSTGRIHGYIGFVLATLVLTLIIFGRA